MCTVIVCFPGFDVTNFEINLSLFIKPFSHMTKKVKIKRKYEIKRWNKKYFLSLIKRFMETKKTKFLEGKSPTLRLFFRIKLEQDII